MPKKEPINFQIKTEKNETPERMKITWIVNNMKMENGKLSSIIASTRYRALTPATAIIESKRHDLKLVSPHQVLSKDNVLNKELLKVDVVVLSKIFNSQGEKIAIAARELGAKTVIDYCDHHFDHIPYYKTMPKLADTVIATNKSMSELVKKETGADAIVIGDPCENPYRPAWFQVNNDECLKVLWFGSGSNFDTLVYFLPHLANLGHKRPLHLHVVTQNNEKLLDAIKKSQVNYSFSEWSVATLHKAFESCHLVVIPSYINQRKSVKSPNRLIESIWAGKMVVAYPLPSYQEFGDYAKLTEDLVEGILWCLENQAEVISRIKKGQEYIKENYTPTQIGLQWEKVFMALKQEKKLTPKRSPVKLNLGCGNKLLKDYVNVDVVETRQGQKPDVISDIRKLDAFPDDSADEILAVHVVEHFWRWEVGNILKEWIRVLRPGGTMILECPNILTAASELLKNPQKTTGTGKEAAMTMWVLYGDPGWKDPLMCHRWGYTPESLASLMQEVGLVNVRQEPAQFKRREPRDMRIVGEKPPESVDGKLVDSDKNISKSEKPLFAVDKSVKNPDKSMSLEKAFEFYESRDFMQAELICNRILKQNSEHPEALRLLGMIHYQLNQGKVAPVDAGLGYHLWYYNTGIWKTTSWAGVRTLKLPSDMWNYQEIIAKLKPSLIVEFGSRHGGSALFFSAVLKQVNPSGKVLSVDIDSESISNLAKEDPTIELKSASSTSPQVLNRIAELRQEYPGSIFVILDSDHKKPHVLNEMLLLRPLLQPGDYLVVEDSNINGHPVRPGWGEGPYEAIQEYFRRYPNDYQVDRSREDKFGLTFATGGFLIRKN